MQAIFDGNEKLTGALRSTLSAPRLARYVTESGGDSMRALCLYHWNAQLSQCLYLPVQIWEVALRNKMNGFLCYRYNPSWPYDQRALREMKRSEREKLDKTLERQARTRNLARVPTDAIVADLSAGYWVGLLTKGYDIPYSWRYNIGRVFPHDPGLTREVAWSMCEVLLDVRNRIAHHEPIYHLPLHQIRADLRRMIAGMCPGADAYAEGMCSFDAIWNARP